MLLEKAVKTLLFHLFGDFIDGLTEENFNINLLTQQAVLRDLSLKKEALDKFELPVTVVRGSVGELRVRVKLSEMKIEIHLNNIKLLAGPKSNEENSRDKFLATKKRLLQIAEIASSQDPSSNSILPQIMNKIHISVNDVHLRYEDKRTNFHFGLKFERLSVITAEKPSKASTSFFKVININGLSVYVGRGEEAQDLLETLNFQVDLEIKPLTIANNTTYKLQFSLNLPRINLALNELQYNDILNLAEFFHRYRKSVPYLDIPRPKGEAKNEPLQRWKFAIAASTKRYRQLKSKFSFQQILKYKEARTIYVDIYSRKLLAGSLKSDQIAKTNLARIEERFSIEDILLFRDIANFRYHKLKEAKIKSADKLTKRSMAQLLSAFEHSQYLLQFQHKQLKLPLEIDHSINVKLDELNVTVLSRRMEKILHFTLENNHFNMKIFNNNSIKIEYAIKSISLLDHFSRPSSATNLIHYDSNNFNHLVIAKIDIGNKEIYKFDFYLDLQFAPIHLLVPHQFVYRLYRYFYLPLLSKRSLRDLEVDAYLEFQKLKKITKKNFQTAVKKNQQTIGVNLQVRSFALLLPIMIDQSVDAINLSMQSLEFANKQLDDRDDLHKYDINIEHVSLTFSKLFLNELHFSFEEEKIAMIDKFSIRNNIFLSSSLRSDISSVQLLTSIDVIPINITIPNLSKLLSLVKSINENIERNNGGDPLRSSSSSSLLSSNSASNYLQLQHIISEIKEMKKQQLQFSNDLQFIFNINEIKCQIADVANELHTPHQHNNEVGEGSKQAIVDDPLSASDLLFEPFIVFSITQFSGEALSTSHYSTFQCKIHQVTLLSLSPASPPIALITSNPLLAKIDDDHHDHARENIKHFIEMSFTMYGNDSPYFNDQFEPIEGEIPLHYQSLHPNEKLTPYNIDVNFFDLYVLFQLRPFENLLSFMQVIQTQLEGNDVVESIDIKDEFIEEIKGVVAQQSFTWVEDEIDFQNIIDERLNPSEPHHHHQMIDNDEKEMKMAEVIEFIEKQKQIAKVTITLRKLEIRIPWNSSPFLFLSLHSPSISYSLTSSFTLRTHQLNGNFGKVRMEYLLAPANELYGRIIEFDDEKSIEFGVKYAVPIEDSNLQSLNPMKDSFRFDVELEVKITSLRIVYLQQFYFNLIAFILEKKETTKLVISQAEKIKKSVEKTVGIDVTLTNFTLAIPQSCDHPNSLLLHIDKIDLYNQFTPHPEYLIESIFIVVGNAKMQSRVYHSNPQLPIIDSIASSSPFLLVVESRKRRERKSDGGNELELIKISGKVENVAVIMNERTIQLALGIIHDNVCDRLTKSDMWATFPELLRLRPTPPSPNTSLVKVDLVITSADLRLFSTPSSSPQQMEEGEIIKVAINQTQIDVTLMPTNEIEIAAQIQSVAAHHRHNHNKEALPIFSITNEKGSLDIQVKIADNEDKDIILKLYSPFIQITPNVLADLYILLSDLPDQLLSTYDLILDYMSFLTHSLKNDQIKKDISIDVNGMEMIIPLDWKLPSTPAYAITSDASLKLSLCGPNVTLLAKINQMEVEKCIHWNKAKSFSVISPFDMQYRIELVDENISIHSEVSNINATVSLRDIEQAKRVQPSWEPHIRRVMEKLEGKKKGDEEVGKVTEKLSSHVLRVLLHQIKLSLIDDISPYPIPSPLLALNLHSLNMSVSRRVYRDVEITESIDLTLEFNVSVDYYNGELEVYEPVLETCSLIFVFYPSQRLFVISTVGNPQLELNISKSLIDSILHAYKVFLEFSTGLANANQEEDLQENEQRYNPNIYYIQNNTEIPLNYSTSLFPTSKRLEPFTREPLIFFAAELAKYQQKKDEKYQLMDVLTLNIEGNDPNGIYNAKDINVPINVIGSQRLHLSHLPLYNQFSIIDLNYKNGVKVVTIRSNVFVVNHTQLKLSIYFHHDYQTSTIFTLDYLAVKSVPLNFLTNGFVYLSADEHYQFDNSQGIELRDIKNCKEGDRRRVVQIKPHAGNPNLNDLFISVIIENQKDDVYIHLHPVFLVENLLPIPLTFLVRKNGQSSRVRSVINEGNTLDVHFANLLHPSALCSILLPHYSPSEEISPSKEQETNNIRFQLKSEKNAKQGMMIKGIIKKEKSVQKLSIYSDFWIINKTDIGELQIHSSYEIPVPSQKSNPSSSQIVLLSLPDPTSLSLFLRIQNLRNPTPSFPLDEPSSADPQNDEQNNIMMVEKYEQSMENTIVSTKWENTHNIYEEKLYTLSIPIDRARDYKIKALLFSISVEECAHQFWRSRKLLISYRYLIENHTDHYLMYMQHSDPLTENSVCPHSYSPLHSFHGKDLSSLSICFSSSPRSLYLYRWSVPFSLRVGSYAIKLRNAEHRFVIVFITIKIVSATTVISISTNIDVPHLQIENFTPFPITLSQFNDFASYDILESDSISPYSFDTPKKPKFLYAKINGELRVPIPLKSFKQTMEEITTEKGLDTVITFVHVMMRENGPTKTITFQVYDHSSTPLENVKKEFNYLDDFQIDDQMKTEPADRSLFDFSQFSVSFSCSSIAIFLIDEKPQELLHINIKKLDSTITKNKDHSVTIAVNIERIQIDNQIAQTLNPILFEPSADAQRKYFISFFVNIIPLGKSIIALRDFNLDLQQMCIVVDRDLLVKLLNFFTTILTIVRSREKKITESMFESNRRSDDLLLYLKNFRISPIEFVVRTTGEVTDDLTHLLPWFLRIITKNLKLRTNIALKEFHLDNFTLTKDDLISQIGSQYRMSIVKSVIGSVSAYLKKGVKTTSEKLRPARCIAMDKIIKTYNPIDASYQYLLHTISSAKYKNDCHQESYSVRDGTVLLTDKRILYIKHNNKNQEEWEYQYNRIVGIQLTVTSLILCVKPKGIIQYIYPEQHSPYYAKQQLKEIHDRLIGCLKIYKKLFTIQ